MLDDHGDQQDLLLEDHSPNNLCGTTENPAGGDQEEPPSSECDWAESEFTT